MLCFVRSMKVRFLISGIRFTCRCELAVCSIFCDVRYFTHRPRSAVPGDLVQTQKPTASRGLSSHVGLRNHLTSASAPSLAEIHVGIDVPSVLDDLEMEMGPRGAPGVAALGDCLPLLHVLPSPHDDAGEVRVEGLVSPGWAMITVLPYPPSHPV